MRSIACGVLLVGVVAIGGAWSSEARAQDKTYVEKKTAEGQFVGFEDDPMSAITSNPVGMQLWGFHPPRRFDLMRPRANFVPELLKAVENL